MLRVSLARHIHQQVHQDIHSQLNLVEKHILSNDEYSGLGMTTVITYQSCSQPLTYVLC